MTIKERNDAIHERMTKYRDDMKKATPEERKRKALELLVATGMYTEDGKIKPEFRDAKKAS